MIEVKNIKKVFAKESGISAILFDGLNLQIIEYSITGIIAPQSSGKTTLLKIISGLENQTSGEISNGKNISFIPSEPSSFPWLNVRENILFGLPNIQESEFNDVIRLVGLEGYESHFPNNNSYGFRFRISLARSIIRKPKLICLDEPFYKLDEQTKHEIYDLILQANRTKGITFLLATTNITEVLYLSNKIYLTGKDHGKIVDSFDVNFPKERNIGFIKEEEFVSMRTKIENVIKKNSLYSLMNFSI
ncbi:MAG: ATP-binding cassette domain-containing protein [Bacteroidota bacterium]